ncbi:hypothetical protein RND71_021826 [Anisodus tanguticus]|uniref:PHD finger protein ALFIN-LIKE n=1 Tax=Anisodus tanguticus TaxID=243964 RepID=A0AAE1RYW6_9SOLA|nr:hypothetical protein RND71_021826 [Anisodus tanguticus]
MASVSSSLRSVEEIFKDYSSRRAAIVRALTYDVDEFYNLCDPEKENLCLYGHPNETWEVNLPAEEVPPELPEPALGINFARDGMNRRDWLSLVAVHSDCWLLSVSFYFGARLNRNERKRLFSLINDVPTVFEVVTERKPIKDKPSADSGSRSRGSSIKRSSEGQAKAPQSTPKVADESYEEDEEEHGETLCGSCGGNYSADEFWIGCDICEKCFGIVLCNAWEIQRAAKFRYGSNSKRNFEGYGDSWVDNLPCEKPPTVGKFERRSISEILPNFSATAGTQLNEALQMHMDAHKRLSDHVEVQRNLKMKLEAQGRFLDQIMEEQKARASGSRPTCKFYSYSPLSLPSLCEESESNVKELEVEYDSEVDRTVDPGCQARKRTRFEEDALNHRHNSTNLTYSPQELQWSTLATYPYSVTFACFI